MNILVFTTLFPNHVEKNKGIFVYRRMSNLTKIGDYAIKVVNPIPYCPPFRIGGRWSKYRKIKRYEKINDIDVFHPVYPLVPKLSMQLHGILLMIGAYRLIRQLNKTHHFDLIDAHYIYPDGFAAILLGKALKLPVVISARGSDINQFSYLPTIKPLVQWTLKHSSHIISVCDALKRRMNEIGISNEKISVISNGVDTNIFYLEDKYESRYRLGLNKDEKAILSVGSLIPRKGFHILIEAMPQILKCHPNAKIYIIGEGEYRQNLENKIKELKLQNYITLLGEIPNTDLRLWYSSADIFCLASSREGWANVIMESLSCGTPVVATNVWGAPEIITSPELGALVDRNPNAIAEKIIFALNKQWDNAAIHKHVARRSWPRVASEVADVFCSVLEKITMRNTKSVKA